MSGKANPWEKALLVAGAQNAPAMTMRASLEHILESKCPRCKGCMGVVNLTAKRKALHCVKDRIVLPLPVEAAESGAPVITPRRNRRVEV